jgi:DNA-binding transcriptional regulator YdaS (Cro superfamily)
MGGMKQISTVANLVEHLGGTSKAAAFFAVNPSAVSNWRKSDRLPAWVIPRVIAMATEHRVSVCVSLLETSKPGPRRSLEHVAAE